MLDTNTVIFIDAAHIIPFSVSRNDHPSNGLALCKNHHWAMDQNLIALDAELRWHVSSIVDARRSSGEAELFNLNGHPILNQPSEPDFRPDRFALEWRLEKLRRA